MRPTADTVPVPVTDLEELGATLQVLLESLSVERHLAIDFERRVTDRAKVRSQAVIASLLDSLSPAIMTALTEWLPYTTDDQRAGVARAICDHVHAYAFAAAAVADRK